MTLPKKKGLRANLNTGLGRKDPLNPVVEAPAAPSDAPIVMSIPGQNDEGATAGPTPDPPSRPEQTAEIGRL